MEKITKYTPTAGLTKRNDATYYNAIKKWFLGTEVFTKNFEITTDDSNKEVKLIPKDESLQACVLRYRADVASTYCRPRLYTKVGSKPEYIESWDSDQYSKDVVFSVYESENGFAMGMGSEPFIYGIYTAISFSDGSKKSVVVARGATESISKGLGFCAGGNVFSGFYKDAYNRISGGVTEVYKIQQMPVAGTDLLLDNVYYFDGGMSLPPADFTVGNDRYVSLFSDSNICLKL